MLCMGWGMFWDREHVGACAQYVLHRRGVHSLEFVLGMPPPPPPQSCHPSSEAHAHALAQEPLSRETAPPPEPCHDASTAELHRAPVPDEPTRWDMSAREYPKQTNLEDRLRVVDDGGGGFSSCTDILFASPRGGVLPRASAHPSPVTECRAVEDFRGSVVGLL